MDDRDPQWFLLRRQPVGGRARAVSPPAWAQETEARPRGVWSWEPRPQPGGTEAPRRREEVRGVRRAEKQGLGMEERLPRCGLLGACRHCSS